jgi:glycosidase
MTMKRPVVVRAMRAANAALLALVAAGALSCRPSSPVVVSSVPTTIPANASVPSTPPPAWSRDAVIYEVNVRQYTPEGTFRALQAHLPRLDSLGVDVLWLMPVQPIGLKNRKGPLGSYYSIADYTKVNPEFGTQADFRAFVDEAHRLGMRVILDWVANHTAWDHPWITQHPDWYTHRADGTISYPRNADGTETDWTDVADLNYDNQDMRRQMLADMRWWVDMMNVDGFRCDVAWGVPMDFWREMERTITAVKPDAFFLAESEGPQYHAAFHASYAWNLHHVMNLVAQGKAPVDSLDSYLARERAQYPAEAYRMTFTSNHDENSWQGSEFERMGANHLPAYVVSATFERAFPLIYTGQEASLRRRLRFFEKDTVDWRGPSLAPFYAAMSELKTRNPALWNGAAGGPMVRLAGSGGNVYAFTRTKGSNTVLVAANFGSAPLRLSYSGLGVTGRYTDWFSKASMDLGTSGTIEIPANGYRVLVK